MLYAMGCMYLSFVCGRDGRLIVFVMILQFRLYRGVSFVTVTTRLVYKECWLRHTY